MIMTIDFGTKTITATPTRLKHNFWGRGEGTRKSPNGITSIGSAFPNLERISHDSMMIRRYMANGIAVKLKADKDLFAKF